ncbi:MAG: TetR/AcrR family transcriptional regulator [Kiritimatiellae bacterium]|nr:TetR/AcrR family transcriptional regulator [Kiritimatiellia bacterium]
MAKGDKREAILKAAEKVFRNRRFDEVKLDEVAAAAHVGKGTIYLYFKDKEDLFFQVATDGFDQLQAKLRKIAASDLSVRDKLCAIGHAMGDMFLNRHALFRIIISQEFTGKRPRAREAFVEHMRRQGDIIKGVFREGVEQGVIRGDVDPEIMECAFTGAVHSRDRRKLHREMDISLDALIDTLLEGSAAKPRGKSG